MSVPFRADPNAPSSGDKVDVKCIVNDGATPLFTAPPEYAIYYFKG